MQTINIQNYFLKSQVVQCFFQYFKSFVISLRKVNNIFKKNTPVAVYIDCVPSDVMFKYIVETNY